MSTLDMGSGNSFWRHLRGKHRRAHATNTVPTDSRSPDDQVPAINGVPVKLTPSVLVGYIAPDPVVATEVVSQEDEKDTAKAIWLGAYKRLEEEEETKTMVEAYETILVNQLGSEMVEIGGNATISLSGCRSPEEKISGMRRVTEVTLEKASRNDGRKQGFVKAAKVMSTISSAVVKPMLQTEAVASLAWAGVCVALEFAILSITADIEMVDGLCHVAKRMEWYMLLHTLLLENAQSSTCVQDSRHTELRDCLKKSIHELYYSLLMYEMQCVCHCYRSSRIIKTVRALVKLDDWKGTLDDIKQLESRIHMDVLQFAQIQTKNHLDRITENAEKRFDGIDRLLWELLTSNQQALSIKEVKHARKLVGHFGTSDYNKQMKLNPARAPGTCEWFCSHNTFKKWLDKENGLLLVSAGPGCGKSTLARHLIEEVLSHLDPKCEVLYFFFNDNRNEQRRLTTAMYAVLHQLLLNKHDLVLDLEVDILESGVHLTAGANLIENSSRLCKLFSTACRAFSDGIICVFDALDECDPDDSHELIRYIKDMLDSDMKVKFLVTTRGYPRLMNQFKEYDSGLIHLDGDGKQEKDAIQQEINLVLDHKLDHLSKMKRLDQQPERKAAIEIALRLKGSEQRTYLWLKLVFDIMEQIPWKSDNDWKKLIVSPPQNVNDAYATLLQNVPGEEKAYVKIVLHLMVAAYRPLTLREMNIALIVRDSPGDCDEKSLGFQSEAEFKDWIIQTCGFFVTVYDNRLSFIHQTAKEFLVGSGPGMLWPQGPDRFLPVTDEAAHKFMAESSIAYLSLKCFSSRQFRERAQRTQTYRSDKTHQAPQDGSRHEESLYSEYGFLDYSTMYWNTHFKLCQSLDGMDLRDVADEFIPHYISLFTSSDFVAPGWMFIHFLYHRRTLHRNREHLAGRYNMCDAALWFDHTRLLVYNLGQNTCANESLLHTAAASNAADCVQYLAVTGHDINAQDESGATALCSAARNGSMEAVSILLDHNADVNLSAGPGMMPLSYLAQQYAPGHVELVRRIVHRGADLNNTSVPVLGTNVQMTPLTWATLVPRGDTPAYTACIRKLDCWVIEKQFTSDLRNVDDFLQSPDLSAADEFLNAYNESFVKLFLDHGADIDGVDPNWSSGDYGLRHPKTALEYACHRALEGPGDEAFCNAIFLLHRGANSSLNVETGDSALDWLIRERYTRVALGNSIRWSMLATLLLRDNPPSNFINSPISNHNMQTRLHSLSASHEVSYRREKAKFLLDHGAAVDCQDLYGKTPMHYIVSHTLGASELSAIIEMFIAKGARLEVQDSLGRTPIHYVRSPVVFDTLVKNGADIEARDNRGKTSLQADLFMACL